MQKFDCFDDAYNCLLSKLYYSPEFTNTPRGSLNRECLNVSISIESPRNRICYNPSRRTNLIFNFAEALWYLSGSRNLNFIEYYCKSMRRYSPDGQILTGCAYGPKIFAFGEGKLDQWERVVKMLSEDDPFSNRALIQIFDPRESLYQDNRDVTCTIALQFFLRAGKLYLSTYMRSNDCYRGMVSDIFSFTFLQELMASQLNVEMGAYFHNVGSLHLYERDCDRVLEVLKENAISPTERIAPLKMPPGDNWESINVLLEYEEKLRNNALILDRRAVETVGLPEYWIQILLLFGIYRDIFYEDRINLDLMERLDLSYHELIRIRWDSKLVCL